MTPEPPRVGSGECLINFQPHLDSLLVPENRSPCSLSFKSQGGAPENRGPTGMPQEP